MKYHDKYDRARSYHDLTHNEGYREYEPYSSIRSMGNAYWQDPKPHYGPSFGPHFGKGPKGYQRSDDRIKDDVHETLRIHSEIDATEIEIDVKAGVVSLLGTVDSRKTKRAVENEVELISGVLDIKNDLKILSSVEGPYPGWGKELPSRNLTKGF